MARPEYEEETSTIRVELHYKIAGFRGSETPPRADSVVPTYAEGTIAGLVWVVPKLIEFEGEVFARPGPIHSYDDSEVLDYVKVDIYRVATPEVSND